MVVIHTADMQYRDGAKFVLEQVKGTFSRLQLIWADAGYPDKLVDWVNSVCGRVLEIVKRIDDAKGFDCPAKKQVYIRSNVFVQTQTQL